MKAITQEWLDYAKTDLMSCENNISNEYLTNIVAFHCQQTVEKCFKAIMEEKSLGMKRIHSLFQLYTLIRTHIDFDVDIENIELLDEVYTTSRYPGEIGLMKQGKPTKTESQEMFEFATYIYNKTIEMIEK